MGKPCRYCNRAWAAPQQACICCAQMIDVTSNNKLGNANPGNDPGRNLAFQRIGIMKTKGDVSLRYLLTGEVCSLKRLLTGTTNVKQDDCQQHA